MLKPRSLTQMARCLTAYEIGFIPKNAEPIPLAFAERVNKNTLWNIMTAHLDKIRPFLTPENDTWKYKKGEWTSNCGRIGKTGKTERDIANELNLI